jgi:hypothetical protein
MYTFCKVVAELFGKVYMREPNVANTTRLLLINEFTGMLGSIDCMYWEWKYFPFAWQGQYKGHAEGCIVVLEADGITISLDLSFFRHDIKMLQRSAVFSRLAEGNAPSVHNCINGHSYT